MLKSLGILIFFLVDIFYILAAPALADEQNTDVAKVVLKKELSTRINVAQISFTNWAKGGDNTITYNTGLSSSVQKDYASHSWFFQGNFDFGQTKQGDKGMRNTLDRIDVDAGFTVKKKKFMNPYFLMTLDTQFAKGYDYKKVPAEAKSDFWDPAYMVQSLGSGVRFDPVLQTKLGIAVKETFTNQFRQYSDNAETARKEWLRIEPGINSRTDVLYEINHSMKVISKLEMFSNLKAVQQIDVHWDSMFEAKLAKYFSVNFNIYALYDIDDSQKTQVKQFLGIGFSYNFL